MELTGRDDDFGEALSVGYIFFSIITAFFRTLHEIIVIITTRSWASKYLLIGLFYFYLLLIICKIMSLKICDNSDYCILVRLLSNLKIYFESNYLLFTKYFFQKCVQFVDEMDINTVAFIWINVNYWFLGSYLVLWVSRFFEDREEISNEIVSNSTFYWWNHVWKPNLQKTGWVLIKN